MTEVPTEIHFVYQGINVVKFHSLCSSILEDGKDGRADERDDICDEGIRIYKELCWFNGVTTCLIEVFVFGFDGDQMEMVKFRHCCLNVRRRRGFSIAHNLTESRK